MHKFIYPSKDSFITNKSGYTSKNFGLDEILEIKAKNQIYKTYTLYSTSSISASYDVSSPIIDFTGIAYGYISGSLTSSYLIASGSSEYFSPYIRGYLSGSLNGTNITSSITSSGYFIGYSDAMLSGSISGSICDASGSVSHFNGRAQGVLIGSQSIYNPLTTFTNNPEFSRILLKFDVSAISKSLVSNAIKNLDVSFKLKLNATQLDEIPTDYSIYAFPVSGAWEGGTGKYAYGGSSIGNNWYCRASNTLWYPTASTKTYDLSDYLNTASLSYKSFQNGGGTWYYSVSDSFIQPSSKKQTIFYDTLGSGSSFADLYSASLYAYDNSDQLIALSGSDYYNTLVESGEMLYYDYHSVINFAADLSSSLEYVVNTALSESIHTSSSYSIFYTFSNTIYTQISNSLAFALGYVDALIDSGSAEVILTDELDAELEFGAFLPESSSADFIYSLSSSISNLLYPSASAPTNKNDIYNYYKVISSSFYGDTDYEQVYDTMDSLVTASISSSTSASSVYQFYTDYYNNLLSQLSGNLWYSLSSSGCDFQIDNQIYNISKSLKNDEYLSAVFTVVYPYVYTSSLNLVNVQWTSSVTLDFSSSFISYFNDKIYQTELFASQSAVTEMTQSFISSFCSSVDTGSLLTCKQDYSYQISNLDMNVTNIVKSWICGCIPNEGIILVSSMELSDVSNNNAVIKFFSKETNTIYSPLLDIAWDDSVYLTGSMQPVNSLIPYTVSLKNVSKEYKLGSVNRINIFARDKNPLKNFTRTTQLTQFLTSSLLSQDSYFAIMDNESDKYILDFDENTKLSCDGNVHYFIFDTSNFPVERYYKILIKTILDGETLVFDNGTIFKVIR